MSSSARKLVVMVAILLGGWFLPTDGSGLFGPAVAQATKSKNADTFEVAKKKKKKKKKGKKKKKKTSAAIQQASQAQA
jgi:hypothetical protein